MIDIPALTALLDDQSLVRKYLDQFAIDMPALLQQMQSAADNAQWDQLHLHAHTYKSQLQYINAASVIPIAITLEHIDPVNLPASPKLDEMFGILDVHLHDVIAEIKRINA